MKKVKIKAIAGATMIPGKVYLVSEEVADILVKKKAAVLADEKEKVGQVYDYPKGGSRAKSKSGSDLTD